MLVRALESRMRLYLRGWGRLCSVSVPQPGKPPVRGFRSLPPFRCRAAGFVGGQQQLGRSTPLFAL